MGKRTRRIADSTGSTVASIQDRRSILRTHIAEHLRVAPQKQKGHVVLPIYFYNTITAMAQRVCGVQLLACVERRQTCANGFINYSTRSHKAPMPGTRSPKLSKSVAVTIRKSFRARIMTGMNRILRVPFARTSVFGKHFAARYLLP